MSYYALCMLSTPWLFPGKWLDYAMLMTNELRGHPTLPRIEEA